MHLPPRPARRRRFAAASSVACTVSVAASVLVGSSPAQASEVIDRPGANVLEVSGHGYGHGRGMSQWGAYGAAVKGLPYQKILAFYYPGTTLCTLANAVISVQVTSDTDGFTEVQAESGLRETSGGKTFTLPTHELITRWRVLSSSGFHLQYFNTDKNAWRDWLPGGQPVTGAVTFTGADGTVRLLLPGSTWREYIGTVTGTRYNNVHTSVVGTTMETYLRGVVPNEMPASWASEALRAQAVAARTYAASQRLETPAGRPWQTCDSTSCQVFDGYIDYTSTGAVKERHTDSRSDAAISATVNSAKVPYVVKYGSQIAFTEFSASNGGYSTAGSVPYLVAKPDPYDGVVPNAAHSWNDSVSVATLEARYPSIGHLVSLSLKRDGKGEWGGRVDSATLVGTAGRVVVSGTDLARQAGFLHRWFAVRYAPPARDMTSDGNADLVARVASTGQLRVYRGDGSRYADPVLWGTGWNGMSVVQGSDDFTGDGLVDVVAVQRSTGNLYVYPVTGDGRVRAGIQIGHGWGSLRNVTVAGDLSGDGLTDIVGVASDGRLLLYPGTGTSGVTSGRTAGTGWSGFDKLVGIGDVDGDGHDDLLGRVLSSGRLYLYHGSGGGRFRSDTVVTGTGWNAMSMLASAGDLTGDGRPDVVAVEKATGILWRYTGNDGALGARTAIGTGWNGINALG
jgi:SpoIID/LytB domain protein